MDVVAIGVDGFTPDVSPELPEAVLLELAVPGMEEPVLAEPEVPEPDAPIELVLLGVLLPVVLLLVSVLAVPELVLPPIALVLGEVLVAGAVSVDELVVALGVVVVAAVSSRLLQALRETTATSARAAAEVRVVFIGEAPRVVRNGKGRPRPPSPPL